MNPLLSAVVAATVLTGVATVGEPAKPASERTVHAAPVIAVDTPPRKTPERDAPAASRPPADPPADAPARRARPAERPQADRPAARRAERPRRERPAADSPRPRSGGAPELRRRKPDLRW